MNEERWHLSQVALGKIPADVYIKNGQLVSVLSGEIIQGWGVAIRQERIAYVGPQRHMVGKSTEIVDAEDMYLVPGYIDAHAHFDLLTNPVAVAAALLPLGTTSALSYNQDIATALGKKGIDYMLNFAEQLPLKIYFAMTPFTSYNPTVDGPELLPASDIQPYFSNPRIRSLGEIACWDRVLAGDRDLLEKMDIARWYEKRVDGHTNGCKLHELNALVAAGYSSCHEALTPKEALERLRLGLYTMLRHGSVRQDLPGLVALINEQPGLSTSRLLLTPDWMSAPDIVDKGYLDFLIKEALALGIKPIMAYQMATINPAMYLGLDEEIGCIAPGRIADILFLETISQPRPVRTMVNGRWLHTYDGLFTRLDLQLQNSLATLRRQFIPNHPVTAADFEVRGREANFPIVHICSTTITRKQEMRLPVSGGLVTLPPADESDVMKVSVPNLKGTGFVTGFLTGFGAPVGGLAATIAVGSSQTVIIGRNDQDMALAFNHLCAMGGGLALFDQGQLLHAIPMSIGGIQSAKSVPEFAAEIKKLYRILRAMGCKLQEPLFTLHFLTISSIPFIRITPAGIYDVSRRTLLE